jgi:uncharacterized protein YlaI
MAQMTCSECDRAANTLTPTIVNHTLEGHPVLAGWCDDCRENLGITSTKGSIEGLLKHRDRIKAHFDCSDAMWAELFAVEAALRAFDACPYATYNED